MNPVTLPPSTCGARHPPTGPVCAVPPALTSHTPHFQDSGTKAPRSTCRPHIHGAALGIAGEVYGCPTAAGPGRAASATSRCRAGGVTPPRPDPTRPVPREPRCSGGLRAGPPRPHGDAGRRTPRPGDAAPAEGRPRPAASPRRPRARGWRRQLRTKRGGAAGAPQRRTGTAPGFPARRRPEEPSLRHRPSRSRRRQVPGLPSPRASRSRAAPRRPAPYLAAGLGVRRPAGRAHGSRAAPAQPAPRPGPPPCRAPQPGGVRGRPVRVRAVTVRCVVTAARRSGTSPASRPPTSSRSCGAVWGACGRETPCCHLPTVTALRLHGGVRDRRARVRPRLGTGLARRPQQRPFAGTRGPGAARLHRQLAAPAEPQPGHGAVPGAAELGG